MPINNLKDLIKLENSCVYIQELKELERQVKKDLNFVDKTNIEQTLLTSRFKLKLS